jgi:hypothetical protein
VQVHAVVVAEYGHDPTLGPGYGSLVEATLGEQDDGVLVSEVEGDRHASETGSDDDDGARSRSAAAGSLKAEVLRLVRAF